MLLENLERVIAPFADLCYPHYRKRSLLDHMARARLEERVPVYFTIDVGPNVHLLCEADTVNDVERRSDGLLAVWRVLTSGPGPSPQYSEGNLF